MQEPDEDKALMLRFQTSGDMAAFESLFQRHKDALFTFVLRLCGNRTVAEEVSQHAWLRLLEAGARKAFRREEASFRTYLFRIGRNHYIDEYLRKHANSRTVALDADGEESTWDDDGAADRDAMKQTLARALAQLPFEQREVLAFWADGMGLDDVADITGVTKHTVVSRKKYGLEKLRMLLADSPLRELLE